MSKPNEQNWVMRNLRSYEALSRNLTGHWFWVFTTVVNVFLLFYEKYIPFTWLRNGTVLFIYLLMLVPIFIMIGSRKTKELFSVTPEVYDYVQQPKNFSWFRKLFPYILFLSFFAAIQVLDASLFSGLIKAKLMVKDPQGLANQHYSGLNLHIYNAIKNTIVGFSEDAWRFCGSILFMYLLGRVSFLSGRIHLRIFLSAALSALCFALLHLPSWMTLQPTFYHFLYGLTTVYGMILFRTILPFAIAHSFKDQYAYWSRTDFSSIADLVCNVLLFVSLFCILIACVMNLIQGIDEFSQKRKKAKGLGA